ncbi:MAG: tetratricopeptide repeat protein [Planctomycetes bacterium]|nr:tetratricopeptide repeat protein [Planctomycetota bacterium]
MARKLSRIARQNLFVLIIAAAGSGSFATRLALAEETVRVTSQPAVIQNPFARRNTPSETSPQAATEPQSAPAPPVESTPQPLPPRKLATQSSAGPKFYRNPFARQSPPPPIGTPLLPGPISRWRRSVPVTDEESPVKHAVLADEAMPIPDTSSSPIERANLPWDRLPPAEQLRDMHGQSRLPHRRDQQPLHHGQVETTPLTQPASMVPDGQVADTAYDPFESSGDSNPSHNEAGAFVPPHRGQGSVALPPISGGSDLTAVIVSDYVDTPEGWYMRAEQAAQTAQAPEELTDVVNHCQRGLQAGASTDLHLSLRRLAAWACNRRGELAIEAGRETEAVRDFQSAIQFDLDCWLALHNRGVTLAQQRQMEPALADFNRVLQLNPGLAIAYRNRAELLAALGRMGEAIRDYDRAIEQIGNDASLVLARGYAYHRLGDFDHALVDLNRSIELDNDEPDAFTRRANLHAERGDFGQALEDLEKALQLDPNWAEAHRSLAWLLATCPNPDFRNPQRALAAAQRAAQLAPADDVFVLDALAAAFASVGQFDEAIRVLQRAIDAAPPDLAKPLADRMALYRQQLAFRSGPDSRVRRASHQVVPPGAPRAISREQSRQ